MLHGRKANVRDERNEVGKIIGIEALPGGPPDGIAAYTECDCGAAECPYCSLPLEFSGVNANSWLKRGVAYFQVARGKIGHLAQLSL